MAEQDREPDSSGRPEIFWILFVLVSAAVYLAVVEPARQEAASARRRLERARAELDERRQRLADMRRTRVALEAGDLGAWEAVGHKAGLGRPGDLRVPASEREAGRRGKER